MKQMNNWFKPNKISLNVEKTKLVILKSPRKVLSDDIKIKITGKRLYPSNSVKYLWVRIDKFLDWHDQVNNIAVKLNRANVLLLNIRNYVNMKKYLLLKKYLLRNIWLPPNLFRRKYYVSWFSKFEVHFFLKTIFSSLLTNYLRKYTFCQ